MFAFATKIQGEYIDEGVNTAYHKIKMENPPDNSKIALLLKNGDLNIDRIAEELCKLGVNDLFVCDGNLLAVAFPFIPYRDIYDHHYYPNAILDHLFLGSVSSLTDTQALTDLGRGYITFHRMMYNEIVV